MSPQHSIALSLVLGGLLVGVLLFAGGRSDASRLTTDVSSTTPQTVRIEEGTQIIRVIARGGYTPSVVTARSGIPTRLEVVTKGTYDCSASFSIPSLRYTRMLPPTGTTVVSLGTPAPGSVINALCTMGMYTLELRFE